MAFHKNTLTHFYILVLLSHSYFSAFYPYIFEQQPRSNINLFMDFYICVPLSTNPRFNTINTIPSVHFSLILFLFFIFCLQFIWSSAFFSFILLARLFCKQILTLIPFIYFNFSFTLSEQILRLLCNFAPLLLTDS